MNREDLAKWHYYELIKTLIALCCDAEEQIDIYGPIGAAGVEMLEDFHSHYFINRRLLFEEGLIDEKSESLLDDYWNIIESIHHKENEGFYYELRDHPKWSELREKANAILVEMGKESWKIQLEKEVKNLRGKITSTQTRIHLFDDKDQEVENPY